MSEPAYPTCVPTADGHCSICGDEAMLGRVVAVDNASGTAEVVHDGATATVAIDLVEHVAVGDQLLVHLGFAIGRVADGATA